MPFGDEMTPDDLQALTALGLFAFGESKVLENTTVDNPMVNAHVEDGTYKIRKALMDAERQVKMRAQPQPQPVVPSFSYPEMPPLPPMNPVDYFQIPQIQLPPPVQHPSGDVQLEFSFDPKKQDITNDLLKEISNKLSKILKQLETKNKDSVVKLKV